jgi:hypothetical protein
MALGRQGRVALGCTLRADAFGFSYAGRASSPDQRNELSRWQGRGLSKLTLAARSASVAQLEIRLFPRSQSGELTLARHRKESQ